MLKAEVKIYLKESIVKDALYTEKQYSQIDGIYIECAVWSPTAGYAVTIKKKLRSKNPKYVRDARVFFINQVNKEKEKFASRFTYEYLLDDAYNVLLNDGFEYD